MAKINTRLEALERRQPPEPIRSEVWTMAEYEHYKATGEAPAADRALVDDGSDEPYCVVVWRGADPAFFLNVIYDDL